MVYDRSAQRWCCGWQMSKAVACKFWHIVSERLCGKGCWVMRHWCDAWSNTLYHTIFHSQYGRICMQQLLTFVIHNTIAVRFCRRPWIKNPIVSSKSTRALVEHTHTVHLLVHIIVSRGQLFATHVFSAAQKWRQMHDVSCKKRCYSVFGSPDPATQASHVLYWINMWWTRTKFYQRIHCWHLPVQTCRQKWPWWRLVLHRIKLKPINCSTYLQGTIQAEKVEKRCWR